jgi:hypothetical protein
MKLGSHLIFGEIRKCGRVAVYEKVRVLLYVMIWSSKSIAVQQF